MRRRPSHAERTAATGDGNGGGGGGGGRQGERRARGDRGRERGGRGSCLPCLWSRNGPNAFCINTLALFLAALSLYATSVPDVQTSMYLLGLCFTVYAAAIGATRRSSHSMT